MGLLARIGRIRRGTAYNLLKFGYKDPTAFIDLGCHFSEPTGVFICENVHIGYEVRFINGPGSTIKIMKGTKIAPSVTLLCGGHEWKTKERPFSKEMYKEDLIIGENCWLATRCMVVRGVVIGSGSIIAAGAIVSKNVPEDSIVFGVNEVRER